MQIGKDFNWSDWNRNYHPVSKELYCMSFLNKQQNAPLQKNAVDCGIYAIKVN